MGHHRLFTEGGDPRGEWIIIRQWKLSRSTSGFTNVSHEIRNFLLAKARSRRRAVATPLTNSFFRLLALARSFIQSHTDKGAKLSKRLFAIIRVPLWIMHKQNKKNDLSFGKRFEHQLDVIYLFHDAALSHKSASTVGVSKTHIFIPILIIDDYKNRSYPMQWVPVQNQFFSGRLITVYAVVLDVNEMHYCLSLPRLNLHLVQRAELRNRQHGFAPLEQITKKKNSGCGCRTGAFLDA